jgi:hypothetical protein
VLIDRKQLRHLLIVRFITRITAVVIDNYLLVLSCIDHMRNHASFEIAEDTEQPGSYNHIYVMCVFVCMSVFVCRCEVCMSKVVYVYVCVHT